MHAWSELFGEQALAKLKQIKTKSNTSGASYEIYIYIFLCVLKYDQITNSLMRRVI